MIEHSIIHAVDLYNLVVYIEQYTFATDSQIIFCETLCYMLTGWAKTAQYWTNHRPIDATVQAK